MELSLFTKLKISATLAVGVILIGVAAWPLVSTQTEYEPIALMNPTVSFADVFLITLLAVVAGFLSGLISKPYNVQIGALAGPAGLAALALRSGNMTELLRSHATVKLQVIVYNQLQWAGIFWLLVIFGGILGAIISNIFWPGKADETKLTEKQVLLPKTDKKSTTYLNIAVSMVASLIIAHLVIRLFARDVIMSENGSKVYVQPEQLQISFAVFLAFVVAGFLTKLYLKTSYFWPILATAVLSFIEMHFGGQVEVLETQMQYWPIGYYLRPNYAVLPVQFVAFGSLGAVAGYWWAIRYAWWRQNDA